MTQDTNSELMDTMLSQSGRRPDSREIKNTVSHRLLRPTIGLLLAAAATLSGCSGLTDPDSPADKFRFYQSSSEAPHQLREWIKPGTQMSRALRRLKSQGFSCASVKQPPNEEVSIVRCTYRTPRPTSRPLVTPAAPVEWHLSITSNDGKTARDVHAVRL